MSSRSYPFLLGKALGDNDMFTESVACSGALVLPDFYGEGRYDGQSGENRDKSVSDLADAQRTALQNFTPGQIRQLEFVKEHLTKPTMASNVTSLRIFWSTKSTEPSKKREDTHK